MSIIKTIIKNLNIKFNMKNYKVLFCDLDGTLIETLTGKEFPKGVWDMKLKLDVLDAIKKLKPEIVCIVTNQGGIEKGFVDGRHWIDKMRYVVSCVKEYADVETTCHYCTCNDKNCQRRKPNAGMLQEFMYFHEDKHNSECLMIGDASGKPGQFSDSDKKAAENFGIDYMDVEDFVNSFR